MKTYRVSFIETNDMDDAMDGEPLCQLPHVGLEVQAKNKDSAISKVRRSHDVGHISKIEELQKFQIFDHSFTGLEVVEAFNKKDALKKSICSDKMYAAPFGQLPTEMTKDDITRRNQNFAGMEKYE